MDAGIISFIIFILSIIFVIYLGRNRIERQGIILMIRTKKLKDTIKKIAIKYKLFWNAYFSVGVFVSFFAMLFGLNFFISNALNIINGFGVPTLALVLPGPTTSFSVHPGLLIVPPWHWIAAIIVLIFPHELSHAFALAINKLRIKSIGIFLLLFIPGAFVEPDDKQVKKANKWAQLQVFCAGSFSNIVTGILFVFLFHLFLSSFYSYEGIGYTFPTEAINKTEIQEMANLSTGFMELQAGNKTYLATKWLMEQQENKTRIIVFKDYPAARNNLSGAIKRIDNRPINTMDDLSKAISMHKSGEMIKIKTSSGEYEIVLTEKNEKAFLGIGTPRGYEDIYNMLYPLTYNNYLIDFLFPQSYKSYKLNGLPEGIAIFIYQLIFFIYNVCFGVAIINILPIKPLDGGLALEAITNKKITKYISIIVLILVLYNLIGPFI
ncbi:MAG: site-2 protease family protein [Candidatus Aenigmarchaeota archaeon]|nr:site-2 protease family protein [Candidatus Aenigmarchaeota archaeon]